MTDSKYPNTVDTDQLESLGAERDAADLDTIYGLFTSLGRTLEIARNAPSGSPESRGKGDIGKILRLSVALLWQEPRIPGSGKPKQKLDHNKPFVFPWSEKARDVYFGKKADPTVSTANQLVLEHTHPAKLLTGDLLKMINEGCTKDQWTKFFLEAHKGLSFVILTKEEDNALTKAGLRSAIVSVDEDPSPLARYTKAGVQGEFMSLLDDERWS